MTDPYASLLDQIDEAVAELRSARTLAERESGYAAAGEEVDRRAVAQLLLTIQTAQVVLEAAEAYLANIRHGILVEK